MNRDWLVGIDIGGTFTDVVGLDRRAGVLRTAKVPSRPDDPLGALLAALAAVGLQAEDVENLVHGTTRITNAIVEAKLPPVALVTTAGFEDVLAIARLRRRDLYRLDVPPKLPLLVPAERTFGVAERVRHDGSVELALDPQSAQDTVDAVQSLGVASVAVALLHAYANPVHERALGEALTGRVGHVSLSHQVNPEAREYERTTSTVLNAAATPVVVDYLDSLTERLSLDGRFQLFHSAGGWATPEAVRERPLIMAMSGPAAGVAACARLSTAMERDRFLTFDMGGTTTDVCLVIDGEALVTDERSIAERPMRQPMVAIESIGAGGGSIVRLTSGGLSVGPDSAGADPGPACYGLGGQAPTVTDANAILGYLNPDRRLGGAIPIQVDRARAALAPIADALNRTEVQTALGVVRVANATMARALRRVTVERGIDGRRCSLLAFGGAGPMHAVGLAQAFGIDEVVVPAVSSAFSAYGCLLADMAYMRQRTVRLLQHAFDPDQFERVRTEVVSELTVPFTARGMDSDSLAVEHVALMRYEGQSATVPVPFEVPLSPDRLGEDFISRHTELYGYATAEPWLFEGLRVRVSAPTEAEFATLSEAPAGFPVRQAWCWFDEHGARQTDCYPRETLVSDQAIEGPALVEDAWSTVVIPPGWQGTVDRYANLVLREITT